MADEMFFSKDEKSLIRGSRTDSRTETCRPCVIEMNDAPGAELHGVVLDVTPRGMLIRMLQPIPLNTAVTIQLMRDEQFQKKLSTPHEGTIVRIEETADGFYDHGLQLLKEAIPKASEQPVRIETTRPMPNHASTRMHTADMTTEHGDRNRKNN